MFVLKIQLSWLSTIWLAVAENASTRHDVVMSYDATDLGRHWFNWWLLAFSVPIHYMNQWWFIGYWNIRHILSSKLFPVWWRHQMETFSASLPICTGIHRPPVNSPQKVQWLGALMFSLICAWINGWVSNGAAGDLRRHRAHYDPTVMSHFRPCGYHP